MEKTLKIGKLDHDFLKQLLAKFPKTDKSIIIPPGVGLDAAGIKTSNKYLAITTDPITFSTTNLGTYSVAVNINDVACLGCKPRWYLACLLLPIGTTKKQLASICQNLASELKRYDIQAIGGHIEVTKAVTTPVIVGQMIGEIIGNKLLTPQDGKSGDQILLWRSVAIEGTALLATKQHKLLQKHFSLKKIKAMQNLLFKPGICIWPLVKKLVPCKGLVALHDITEGGIATALHELADASSLGLKINGEAIPILLETKKLAKILNFNPLGLLASGSALILCRKHAVNQIIKKVGTKDLAVIGELTKNKQRILISDKKKSKLPRFDSDEILKVL
jgi:hydrogenase expression/formation protein HypE